MSKKLDKIIEDIIDLTDSLEGDDLHEAWTKVSQVLGYLSAKDSMYKYKKDLEGKE